MKESIITVIFKHLSQAAKLLGARLRQAAVAQTFLSAGSRDFPVPCSRSRTGDRKVASTRRLESLRYGRSVIRLRNSGLNAKRRWLAAGSLWLWCVSLPVGAQIATLHSFTNTPDGADPLRLTQANGRLFGVATRGGTSGNGTIFTYNPSSSIYATIYSFTGPSDLGIAANNLLVSGNTIYGTAQNSGTNLANLVGLVYAVGTNGTGFTPLYSFGGYPDGQYPASALVLMGGTLYGTAVLGGVHTNYGTVFKINTNGTGYATLHSFTNTPDGAQPQSELVTDGSTLYGTTSGGGTSGNGTVFAMSANGASYTILHSFTNAPEPLVPYGGLVLSAGVLYGTGSSGGTSTTNGAIFAINTNGTGLRVLHSFSGSAGNLDGEEPEATLTLNGGFLYGTTLNGGSGGGGTMFSINTNGTGFAVLASFTNGTASGSEPVGGVIWFDNTLWGTTLRDGSGVSGTLFSLLPPAAPVITQQPQNVTVTNGYAAAFTNAASGASPLFYQWYFNTNTPVAGATNAILTISPAATNQAGYYTVIVTNLYGSATSAPAELTVMVPVSLPAITQQPQNYTVTNGFAAAFTNVASGASPLFYQWYFNTNTPVAGGTNAILLLPFAATNQAGYYTVVVTNPAGGVTSSPARLAVVSTAPIIFTQPQPLTVTNGNPVNFSVLAAGQNALKFQWYTNAVSALYALSGQTNTTVAFAAASNNLAGNYLVVITNALGKATSSPALLTVMSKPVITQAPQNVTVTNGGPATFTSAATGAGALSFQWFFRTNTVVPGATNTWLTFTNAITNLAGFYSVRVTNTFGSTTSSYALLAVSNHLNLLAFSFNATNGSASLALANAANSTNRLWASTNLTATNFWQVIATNVMATNGLWFFTDTNIAKTNRTRFYRFSTP